jgi:hypothetical protein
MPLIQRKDVALTGEEARNIVESIGAFSQFQVYYALYDCWRSKINQLYKQILKEQLVNNSDNVFNPFVPSTKKVFDRINNFNDNEFYIPAAYKVWKNKLSQAKKDLEICLASTTSQEKSEEEKTVSTPAEIDTAYSGPFDKRLQRFFSEGAEGFMVNPLDAAQATTSVNGYVTSEKFIQDAKLSPADTENLKNKLKKSIQELKNDAFHYGAPSLINTYSITRLYGSNGGEFITQQRNRRRWYEVDSMENSNSTQNFAVTPTTSSLISWGNGDPYGRTPYHFSDFVFCKWWNVIPNNRMVTLRRFPAPILDNMKFPGMDGFYKDGKPGEYDSCTGSFTASDTTTDNASGSKVSFPPVSTAVTYFGEGTGNTLGTILKMTTGMNWGEVKADMFNVTTSSTPEGDKGPGAIFGSLGKMAKMLNIVQGNYDLAAVMNQGELPPDPYVDGPYSNRIMGPVDRIDAVKKREAGLKFENKIDLVFEYLGRPVGGINPKAALLDIISNFLIMGSASAMFWGGQHRFMGNPVRYPFIGGDKGIAAWYRGDPGGWAKTTTESFGENIRGAGNAISDFAKNFFNTVLSGKSVGSIFGEVINLFTGDNAAGRVIKDKLARAGQGQVPYLSGLKALLIGEPVGEWHVTIGNPLNPIAMIGNLICTGIDLELGEELGPDDFPTSVKITAHLEHGMARDRDAIQSIFNRGMGRIYDLPDNFSFSADFQTPVDKYTDNGRQNPMGKPVNGRMGMLADSGTTGRTFGQPYTKVASNVGNVTVWNREKFAIIPPDAPLQTSFRSTYKSLSWVAIKSLK